MSAGCRDEPQSISARWLADSSMTSEEVFPIGLTGKVRVAPSSVSVHPVHLEVPVRPGLTGKVLVAPSSVPVHPVQHPEVLVIPEQHSEVPVRPERPIPLYFGFLYNPMD